MSPMTHSNNVAARMGRWSASHRKTAILGWLAFVILAVALGTAVGLKQIDATNGNVGQAHQADQILTHAGFKQAGPLTEIVVIQAKHRTISDPAFRATVADVVGAVASAPPQTPTYVHCWGGVILGCTSCSPRELETS